MSEWTTVSLACGCTLGTDKHMRAALAEKYATAEEAERAIALSGGGLSLVYCPLHAAAPMLRNVLEQIEIRCTFEPINLSAKRLAAEIAEMARDALAGREGGEGHE